MMPSQHRAAEVVELNGTMEHSWKHRFGLLVLYTGYASW